AGGAVEGLDDDTSLSLSATGIRNLKELGEVDPLELSRQTGIGYTRALRFTWLARRAATKPPSSTPTTTPTVTAMPIATMPATAPATMPAIAPETLPAVGPPPTRVSYSESPAETPKPAVQLAWG